MADRVHFHPRLILSPGTQVVTLRDVTAEGGRLLHPKGAVGVVVRSPHDSRGPYRVRFLDGVEATLPPADLVSLARFKEGEIGDFEVAAQQDDLFRRVIYRCVIGSRAYGLEHAESDTDRRGIYVPPAELHWSLYGVPEQLENDASQEVYWEVQKFLVLALKANPNVLECLYTPLVELVTPLAEELLAMREAFLSRIVYQTYNGYVMSQFKRMQAHVRNHGEVKFFGLMLKKNGYVMEQVLSPLVLHTTPEHEELRAIAADCLTRHHVHHYLGFAQTQWRLFEKETPPRVKPLLYVYRVLLTGIHLMRSGTVEANLVRLNEEAKLAYIPELIQRKREGTEKERLSEVDVAFHRGEYERLEAELQQSSQASRLPEVPRAAEALNDLLIRLRLKGVISGGQA